MKTLETMHARHNDTTLTLVCTVTGGDYMSIKSQPTNGLPHVNVFAHPLCKLLAPIGHDLACLPFRQWCI